MNTPALTILFRFDASLSVGYGHATRCVALSQEFSARGYRTHFLVSAETHTLLRTFGVCDAQIHVSSDSRASLHDARTTARVAQELSASWIVVDGYDFVSSYIDQLRASMPLRVLAIDDGVNQTLNADIILNQNLDAERNVIYQALPTTKLLLGSAYTLFRKQFRDSKPQPKHSVASRLTLTFGGADARNTTVHVLRILSEAAVLQGLSVRILVGGAYQHRASLESISIPAECNVEVIDFTPDIIDHYRWSDTVISAAGSTAWELALLRIPMALITVADNQLPVAQALSRQGAALYMGDARTLDSTLLAASARLLFTDCALREQLHRQCATVCDCHGARRVVDAVEEFD